MLESLYKLLLNSDLNLPDDWANEIDVWAMAIANYRAYTEGRHRITLTDKQRKMLNLDGNFSIDYTDMVVRAMSERLVVSNVVPVNNDKMLTDFISSILKNSDMDLVQMQLHYAAIRDGVAYIVIGFDNDLRLPILHVNYAFDGTTGMIPVLYNDKNELEIAVKITMVGQWTYCYIYFKNRIDRYIVNESDLNYVDTIPWEPDIFPVVAFTNRKMGYNARGQSEIDKMIYAQDALNRIILDMQMTSSLSAFPIIFVKGFKYPHDTVAPGMMVNTEEVGEEAQYADMRMLGQASLSEYINQADRIVRFIAEITNTPIASVLGSNLSGEALKQRESGLLAKIEAAQIYFGGSWKRVFKIAARIANMPAEFAIEWEEAEVRSDTSILEQAGMVFDRVGSLSLYLKMIGKVLDWDEDTINEFVANEENRRRTELLGIADDIDFAAAFNGVSEG